MLNISLQQMSLWLAAALVIVYTLGQHWRTAYREIMQSAGLLGTGAIIVWWFFSACPAVATGLVLRLLIMAGIIKLCLWLFFRTYYGSRPEYSDNSLPPDAFTPISNTEQERYEKALKEARGEKPTRRPAGFEHTDRERQADREVNSINPK